MLDRVNDYIRKFTSHSFAGTETGDVLDELLLAPGKQIRPRLLLLAAEFGPRQKERRERICMLGAFVEMVHMASLIHDDIVDDAAFRRGRPSLQSRFGKDAAVYAGDFLISRVNARMAREGFPGAAEILSETIEKMCVGEIGQARARCREDITKEQYLENIKGKTASLFKAAMVLGAGEAGCEPGVTGLLGTVGENIGIMFQLRDDLSDFAAGRESAGKDIRKDFREGIYTLPVILAAKNEAGREDILSYMRKNRESGLSPEDIRSLSELVLSFGEAKTREEIRRYGRMSRELLAGLSETRANAGIRELIGKLDGE